MTAQKTAAVKLVESVEELLTEARESRAGRAARTIVTGTIQRATVIALRDGVEMAEHDSPPAATLQVLSGSVRLHAGEREWTLAESELISIPPQRHGLRAIGDAAVLLTVALH